MNMVGVSVLIFIFALLAVCALIGIFFAVRYFIRYNAKVNGRKDKTREEMDKMKIDDL